MLFMVIEHFRNGDPRPIGERFRHSGRMLPDGVIYRGSWIDAESARCYQVMEAPGPELLEVWTRNWDDLVEFEIRPVQTSSDFWSALHGSGQSD
jgi:hypothetical protein